MGAIIRKVIDISAADRSALERLIGSTLSEKQQVVIEVQDSQSADASVASNGTVPSLPEWCNIFEGLTPAEVDDITSAIVRLPSSRPQPE
jgi:hypothetical protein